MVNNNQRKRVESQQVNIHKNGKQGLNVKPKKIKTGVGLQIDVLE